MFTSNASRLLPSGFIFAVAEAGGIEIKRRAAKVQIRCPLHEDRNASAFLSDANVFFCAVCTPNGGMSAKDFAAAINVDWRGLLDNAVQGLAPVDRPQHKPAFTGQDAERVWQLAHDRMRDDASVDADREAWNFISKRRLGEGHELGAFGILGDGMALPRAVERWPSNGYRLVAPLFDQRGAVANVQARAVNGRTPKTLFPSGSSASGTLFACTRGVQVLRGEWTAPRCYILGEGLTDHIALTIASPAPVLCAPGTGMAAAGIGAWVHDAVLYVALDFDDAGTLAVDAVAGRAYSAGARLVRRLEWPFGAKDACDVLDRVGVDGLEHFLRRLFAEVSK
jgi:hypothetical protein